MFLHAWAPLINKKGERCIIWDYDIEEDQWVIYRFVWEVTSFPQIGKLFIKPYSIESEAHIRL